jgi:maleamate amidohydrolase
VTHPAEMAGDWKLYAERGLGSRLSAGRNPAVVVVDLIYGFTDFGFPAGFDLDAVVDSTRRLVDVARQVRAPVIFTTIVFPPELVDRNIWLRKMPAIRGLQPNTRWVTVDERLGRQPNEPVIEKQAASAFSGTSLATVLTSFHVDSIVVCGATTSGCVRATVVDACMAGWPTFVPRECVGDRASGPHDANLFDIDAKYGDVLPLLNAVEILHRRQVP